MMKIMEVPVLVWFVIIAAGCLFGPQKAISILLLYLVCKGIMKELSDKEHRVFWPYGLIFLVCLFLCGFFALTNII